MLFFRKTQILDTLQVELFRKHRSEMAACNKCHRLFDCRAGRSFIMHLVDEHKIDSFSAIDIVSDLGRKLLQIRQERQGLVEKRP